MNSEMKFGMSIAGFDPCGGAGIIRDIVTFRKIGIYGVGVITSITGQCFHGVKNYFSLSPNAVEMQIDEIMRDIKIKFVKVGMVGNEKIANMIAKKIDEYDLKAVVDPLITDKFSNKLIDSPKSIEKLMRKAYVLTPNIPEAEILSGIKIDNEKNLIEAGKILREKFGSYVIIKGGHFKGEDYLIGEDVHRLKMEHLGKIVHGTGCAYSSALTSYLILGYDIIEAFRRAREFIQEEIKNSFSTDQMGVLP